MKKLIKLLTMASLIPCLSLTACSEKSEESSEQNKEEQNSEEQKGFIQNFFDFLGGGQEGVVYENQDLSEKENIIIEASKIDEEELAKETDQSSSNKLEASSDKLTITTAGDYTLSGNYNDGIVISVNDKETVHLFLDGANISSTNGIAISNTNKKSTLIITLVSDSTVSNSGDDVNAIHVKGNLQINGSGCLTINSTSKSAIKVTKGLEIVNASLDLSATGHAINARYIAAQDCSITINSAGKDGLHAECDDETTEWSDEEGYVVLNNVNFTSTTDGDGIQADTFVYINKGSYNIVTNENFVSYSEENIANYELTSDDFRYILRNGTYYKVANDYNAKISSMYALAQGCKGIKVGEIEYNADGDDIDEGVVYDGNYYIMIDDGEFNIHSVDDAIHANSGNVVINGGSYDIWTRDDAITSDNLTKINDGNIDISYCYEGIEGAYVEINGGDISLVSTDDGINAASDDESIKEYINISGGNIYVNADGDGIDSNGSVHISGGKLYVDGPTTGVDTALDSETGIVVDGGYIFSVGSLGMVETPASNSKQYIISYSADSTISANSVITLTDEKGNTLLTTTTKKQSQSVIISSPDLENNKSYKILINGEEMESFTISSIITSLGNNKGFGQGGGRGGFGGGQQGGGQITPPSGDFGEQGGGQITPPSGDFGEQGGGEITPPDGDFDFSNMPTRPDDDNFDPNYKPDQNTENDSEDNV